MFKLEENTMFATHKTEEELYNALNDFGHQAVIGAMFMLNFIALQYKEGNIE